MLIPATSLKPTTPATMPSVIIADDDTLVLEGLRVIIGSFADVKLLGATSRGLEAIKLARETKPDVAILDIRMPDISGIEVAGILLAEQLAAPLLLTTFDEPDLILQALEVGACGYILKNSPIEQIHAAIMTVAAGGTAFSPDILDFIRKNIHLAPTPTFAQLTEREREVVALVAQGLSNEQIASKMVLAHGTVRNHISQIMEKCGLEHRTQIAVRYYANL
jgi:DNA-binding NarL/FixJ family response regulator